MPPPRVLLIAEACNPEWVSVPLVGWSHARAIMDALPQGNVHLVSQIRNRDALCRAGLVEGKDFTAIDSEAVARRLTKFAERLTGGKGKGWTTLAAVSSLSYRYFEKKLWDQLGRKIRAGGFDVVHQLTPLSPTTPATMATRCR